MTYMALIHNEISITNPYTNIQIITGNFEICFSYLKIVKALYVLSDGYG